MSDISIDQLLSLGGIGTGPYGGGDTVRWSPDGHDLLFYASLGGEAALWLLSREGGFPRRVTTAPIALPFLASPQQSFAPGGEAIAFLAQHRGATELWLWEAETSRARLLTKLGNTISSYSWAPDGKSLLVASNRRGTYDIYRVARDSGASERLTNDARYEVSPVATPDGERVLFVRLDEHWQDHEIVSIAAAGGDERVVAGDHDFFDYHYGRTFGPPVLSPNGVQVLFRSHRSGWINYWSVPVDGGEPRQFCSQAADQSGATWSPDGRHVAFVSNTNGTLAIWVCEADGGNARPLVQPEIGVCQAPAWSPDGRSIAYFFASPTAPQDVWMVDVATGERRQLTDSMPVGALAARLTRPEKIQYTSFDGLAINAYLYRPASSSQRLSSLQSPASAIPGILLIHGGPTMQWSDAYDSLAQFLVQRGYAVLMPNIRGSSGYGKHFEDLNNGDWGHDDLRDAIAGADYLRAQDWVDARHIGITGTSYGGCLSMSAVCFAPGAF